jgi:hypothetical protein
MNRAAGLAIVSSLLLITGCSGSTPRAGGGGGGGQEDKPDLPPIEFQDDGGPIATDDSGGGNGGPDVCGDPVSDPACFDTGTLGPPTKEFPLLTDPNKDPLEKDNGVSRDVNGFLKLDSTHTVFNYLWIANTSDLGGVGTASKIDSKTVREVARYKTYTCYSLKTGGTAQCDGMNGCCSIDDWGRYQARKNKMAQPPHQQVQTTNNAPSRTSVDFNGDLFISNRAFGGQSAVTKIANDLANCIDRNKNGKIDTSADTNGNGWIETDCNGDGQPDDIASVKAKPCSNGMKQEFFGDDDECVVWTSNTFTSGAIGRPLGLAGGDTNVSDAWAGSFQLGKFVRIDGNTGLGKDDVQLPQECFGGTGPYGLAVDASGIGWTPDLGSGKLCYFDTKKSSNVGSVRDPSWGAMNGYGITMDRDQNVWVALTTARYTPDRSNGFKNLGQGWWTKMGSLSGIGIAADSRQANAYWVYTCAGGQVVQIPASTIKTMKMDQQIPDPGWPRINMPCRGVGVDSDQNVWGVDGSTSTRALVDNKAMITQPTVNGAPKGNNICPAGDSCRNAGAYTYSDFTGFGLRNFTRPQGTYQYLVKGCSDKDGNPTDTQWWSVVYDADVPPNTTLTVHAKSGDSSNLSHPSWTTAQWTVDGNMSPFSLQGPLTPNLTPSNPNDVVHDSWLLVEFVFKTAAQNASPLLKSFDVTFKCSSIPG